VRGQPRPQVAYDGRLTMHAMGVRGDLDIDALPGADLVLEGIADVERGRDTIAAALARMATPRLRGVGIEVPRAEEEGPPPGHRLYELLAATDPATAHSRYNALVGRMVSFARAAERARSG
jgi:hypothetical protein